jgi:hypothetical protein
MADKNQVEYLVKARHYGNQVEFIWTSDDSLGEVLKQCKEEANRIFNYTGMGAIPTVHIREKEATD